jgi:hypothetical protein
MLPDLPTATSNAVGSFRFLRPCVQATTAQQGFPFTVVIFSHVPGQLTVLCLKGGLVGVCHLRPKRHLKPAVGGTMNVEMLATVSLHSARHVRAFSDENRTAILEAKYGWGIC